jgi:hypothetical protein
LEEGEMREGKMRERELERGQNINRYGSIMKHGAKRSGAKVS